MKFLIDNKETNIPDDTIKEIEQDMGDVEFLYDYCGSIWTGGQCEKCKKKSTKGNRITCGKRYIASTLRSLEIIYITLKTSELLIANKFLIDKENN